MQHHTFNCKLYWKLIVFVKSALLYYLGLFAGSHIDIKSAFESLLDIMSTGGRWEGGSGWGTHVYMADSCQCMAKPIQYCKVNKKKKQKKNVYWWKMSIAAYSPSIGFV